MRYLVMSVGERRHLIEVAGHRGTVLGEADTQEKALTLAAEWRECGEPNVVVIDSLAGSVVRQVDPPDDDVPVESEIRPSCRPPADSIPVAKVALRRVKCPR